MKRHSISVKLFLITSVFFILFISAILFLQSFFFENYYIETKINNFTVNIEKLADKLGAESIDRDGVAIAIKMLDKENNYNTAIINLVKFEESLKNGTFKSEISNFLFPFDQYTYETILPFLMKDLGYSKNYYGTLINDKKPVSYKTMQNNITSLVYIVPVINGDRVESAVVSIMSLQPVGEAVKAFKGFYVYIYLGAVLIIIILSLFYALMITRPLINLKKSAAKIADMDFTARCEAESKDEIGDLARILNFLSEKLGKTLSELMAANKKLKEDIEKERQLEIMRKEFVAGVSHELKTPISLIRGYTEALKDNIVLEKDRETFFEVILDESEKMGSLVNDMLDLSQLETGNFKLFTEAFNISELLNKVLMKFKKDIEKRNSILVSNISRDTVIVLGDILRIEQVIVNFLSNAIRHVCSGGKIFASLTRTNGLVKIEIENEGSHIPEDELNKIWERFYKIDKSRNREAEGTGIGLAIVKNILLLHNAAYGVVNTERGVKFYFELNEA